MTPPFPISYRLATKYATDEIMGWYDRLAALGLHPIPKTARSKAAWYAYWKDGVTFPTRAQAEADIKSGLTDGWFISPSHETVSLLILDFDVAEMRRNDLDPEAIYQHIQAISPSDFVVYSPAGGVHVYYQMGDQKPPDKVTARPGLELRSKALGVGVASFCGQVNYQSGAKKGLPDGFTGSYDPAPYGEFDELPMAAPELLEYLSAYKVRKEVISADRASDADLHVVQQHSKLSYDHKVRRTLEALDHGLDALDGSYEAWLTLWMASWHGSDGDPAVRDFICSDKRILWSDGQRGIDKFCRDWDSHEPREGGYTVASLFKMAYEGGWLQSSSADLTVSSATKIDTQRISEWINDLEEVPKRALLKSQTGSGKTVGFVSLWKRLGMPKAVVFVPSIRLAMDMAATLSSYGVPAMAYRDEYDNVRGSVELVAAEVLVTTLQTFVRRMYVADKGIMARYGLVYIEECDQLFASFATGGGGELGSHVSQSEAEGGFSALAEAFRDGCAVWGVDATATQVSERAFKRFSNGDYVSIINEYVSDKPDVSFIYDRMAAYTLIEQKLNAGHSVVVPCDTASEAVSVYNTMLALGSVLPAEALCVTAASAKEDQRVVSYSRDADGEAAKYRLVVYNSAMGSGVSISSFTPDTVVQMSKGYLTPRVQLQLLNRYRKQAEVYCWYGSRQMTDPAIDPEQFMAAYQDRARAEAAYLLLPLLDRTSLAALRDELRATSQSDMLQQRRNPAQFYRRLLKIDGRDVKSAEGQIVVDKIVENTAKSEHAGRKEEFEHIKQTWPSRPPMSEGFPPDWTIADIRKSLMHAWIKGVLNGNIPDAVNPAYVYETCKRLHKYASALHAFVFQEDAVRASERAIANKERAFATHPNHISRVVLAGLLRYLFETPDEVIAPETFDARSMAFMRIIQDNAELYERVIRRPERSLEALSEHYSGADLAGKVARYVADAIGLKVRKNADGWFIANLQEVLDFMRWQNFNRPVEIDLNSAEYENIRKRREHLISLYMTTLNEKDLNALTARLVSKPLEAALGGF